MYIYTASAWVAAACLIHAAGSFSSGDSSQGCSSPPGLVDKKKMDRSTQQGVVGLGLFTCLSSRGLNSESSVGSFSACWRSLGACTGLCGHSVLMGLGVSPSPPSLPGLPRPPCIPAQHLPVSGLGCTALLVFPSGPCLPASLPAHPALPCMPTLRHAGFSRFSSEMLCVQPESWFSLLAVQQA